MSRWKGILPTHDTFLAMPDDDLESVANSSEGNLQSLALGVSAIGNLLACTASNTETGLSVRAVTDIGFLLESLGDLLSNLIDVEDNAKHYRHERAVAKKREARK